MPNDRLRPDTLFMPYHWVECNTLTADDLDPVSGIPGFKHTPVRLERAVTQRGHVTTGNVASVVAGGAAS